MEQSRPYSKVILSVYCLAVFSIALLTVTVTIITSLIHSVTLTQIYSIDAFFIESCTSIFFVNFIVFLIPAYYFEERFGVKKTLLFGCSLALIGSLLRIGAFSSFWWILIGSIIASIGQPFILNPITKISVVWFAEEQRVIATTISMGLFFIGQGLSYAISTQIVQPGSGKRDVANLMVLECGICLLAIFGVIFLFRDGEGREAVENCGSQSIKEELKMLFKSWNFMSLFLSSFISCGNGNYFLVVWEIVAAEHEFSSKETSYLVMISLVSGLTGCLICSFITAGAQKFKLTCVIFCGGTIFGYIFIYFAFTAHNFTLAAFSAVLYGFFLFPLYTVPLEFACEITYPIRENLSSGLLNCFGQVFAVLPISIAYSLNNEPQVCIGLAVSLQIIAFLLILTTKEDLKRKEAELHENLMKQETLGIN